MEKLLQYAWQFRHWEEPHRTTTGVPVEVIDPGWLNTAGGPDFFNSKVCISGKVWAGNIEIHKNSSEWYAHGHHTDPAYNNVILHVVVKADKEVVNQNGNIVPQIELKLTRPLEEFVGNIAEWKGGGLACGEALATLPQVYIADTIDSLALERIYSKCERFGKYLEISGGDYERALFIALARALGFGTNSDPMERVAASVPLNVFRKHSDSLLLLEAILLGQAGLLDSEPPEYRREYEFMKLKFGLVQPQDLAWKNSGTRPRNFPSNRLRLLARYLHGGFNLMDSLMQAQSPEEIAGNLIPEGYSIGKSSVNSLIINAVAPAIFSYLLKTGCRDTSERIVDLLSALPPERNSITRLFSTYGLAPRNACESQALIELRTKFCTSRKCLLCRIGNRLLKEGYRKLPPIGR